MAKNGATLAVELEAVSRRFQLGDLEVAALTDVDLQVAAGEFVVVLGPSGSGKTTMLNLIGGLDLPTTGRLVVDGDEITDYGARRLTEFRRTHIGFVFQFFNLIPSLTAAENVAFAAELVENEAGIAQALERVGLADRGDHFPAQLSGGEQQRVALARALAKDPPLLLCDEPTGELDFETGKMILGLMRKLNQEEGKTFMVVTHNAAIGAMADRVIYLRSGRIDRMVINDSPIAAEEVSW
ncbi:MAG: ABC transporter ATP-binding protein [Chloroflexota bacterium]|jgi:putative ABC transport system ATP-binding protein|nr:ABC transporter ATP-binding protein [Chloroflexota bacterium]MDP6508201.1 ABC transporter ATP-binding protein [Chloroflexota bacterium]MDP6757863.1 ABC transporter ATP-binding protein [Chloroflexota bacterium]